MITLCLKMRLWNEQKMVLFIPPGFISFFIHCLLFYYKGFMNHIQQNRKAYCKILSANGISHQKFRELQKK